MLKSKEPFNPKKMLTIKEDNPANTFSFSWINFNKGAWFVKLYIDFL